MSWHSIALRSWMPQALRDEKSATCHHFGHRFSIAAVLYRAHHAPLLKSIGRRGANYVAPFWASLQPRDLVVQKPSCLIAGEHWPSWRKHHVAPFWASLKPRTLLYRSHRASTLLQTFAALASFLIYYIRFELYRFQKDLIIILLLLVLSGAL